MGVYHFMRLGSPPGILIGPPTYLAHRYQGWNDDDQRFFALSREEAYERQVGHDVPSWWGMPKTSGDETIVSPAPDYVAY